MSCFEKVLQVGLGLMFLIGSIAFWLFRTAKRLTSPRLKMARD